MQDNRGGEFYARHKNYTSIINNNYVYSAINKKISFEVFKKWKKKNQRHTQENCNISLQIVKNPNQWNISIPGGFDKNKIIWKIEDLESIS